jgi:hypothetical protein
MSQVVAIAGRVAERAPELVATPWAAIIRIILLLDRVFDVFLGTGAPADAVVQRLGGVPANRPLSSKSDTADRQRVTSPTPNRESVIVGAKLVQGERNAVVRSAGCTPPGPVSEAVQHSDGVSSVGVNQAWKQSRSLEPGDGDGKGLRYESDYWPEQAGANIIRAVRVQHRER